MLGDYSWPCILLVNFGVWIKWKIYLQRFPLANRMVVPLKSWSCKEHGLLCFLNLWKPLNYTARSIVVLPFHGHIRSKGTMLAQWTLNSQHLWSARLKHDLSTVVLHSRLLFSSLFSLDTDIFSFFLPRNLSSCPLMHNIPQIILKYRNSSKNTSKMHANIYK